MKYLLLICTDGPFEALQEARPEGMPEAKPEEMDATAWVEEMDRRGIRLLGDRVCPASDATTVRVRDGEVLLTDGPYTETKEQMCGFDVIECANLDEAIEVAARHPMARFGMIEVRPFWTW